MKVLSLRAWKVTKSQSINIFLLLMGVNFFSLPASLSKEFCDDETIPLPQVNSSDFMQDFVASPSKEVVGGLNALAKAPKQYRFPRDGQLLAPYLDLLNASFQIYKLAERPADITSESYPIGHEKNPYASALIPLCSGSFISSREIATATHCLRAKNSPVEEIHIVRRYHYVLEGGRVVQQGYTDERLVVGSTVRNGDLSRVRLGRSVSPPTLQSINGNTLEGMNQFSLLAIGYPNHQHGEPVLTVGCPQGTPDGDQGWQTTCPVEGGMSGGAVISINNRNPRERRQVGVVSLSSSDSHLSFPRFE